MSLENNPELVAIVERINREGPTEALLEQADAIYKKHRDSEQAEADQRSDREMVEKLSKMTTGEKIALGLKESRPARNGVTHHTPAANRFHQATETRMTASGGMMGNASSKILQGLRESSAARGPTKPAA